MALVLMHEYFRRSDMADDFKGFLVNGGILSLAGGIVIGISTATFLSTFVTCVILPAMYFVAFNWMRWVSPIAEKGIASVYGHVTFDGKRFFQDFVAWLFMLFATFLVLEFIVRRRVLRDTAAIRDEIRPGR